MSKQFKFLTNQVDIDWNHTGLLLECLDVNLVVRVLNTTRNFIFNNHIETSNNSYLLIMIMHRIFKDKYQAYLNEELSDNVAEIYDFLISDELTRSMNSIYENAWSGVDPDAEIINYVTEHFNWHEEF